MSRQGRTDGYALLGGDVVLALTKEEHDLIVELIGRPVTQDQDHRLRADTVSGRTRAIDPNTDKPWGG